MAFQTSRNSRRRRCLTFLLAIVLAAGMMAVGAGPALAVPIGDVNENGSIDTTDALYVLQKTVALRELTPAQSVTADVNADGQVNATDALRILQYTVELIDGFEADAEREGMNGLTVRAENGTYTQSRDAVEVEGSRTTFQVSAPYNDSMALPADMVMVYNTEDRGWSTSNQGYVIGAMQMMNKANGTEYHNQHPEDLQIQSDGRGIYGTEPGAGRPWNDIINESSRNSYQSQNYIDHKKNSINQMVEDFNPQTIVFEEPEYFRRGLYGDGYKSLWKEHYGTDWVDPISTPSAVILSQRLNVALECNAISQLSAHYKTLNANGKFGVAAHSHFNYRAHDITAGIYSMAATGKVDALIGQAWSDTIKHSFLYDGTKTVRPYMLGYLEYASLIDAAVENGIPLYTLIDPLSDEKEKHTEEDLRQLNRHQVVSSLMHPEINRWENCIWPDRAFRDVSGDYKTELLSIYNALNDVSGREYKLTAGTPGITYLMSDSFTWQIEGDHWCQDPKEAYYGVAMPLIDDGIPLEVNSMDYIQSAEDLKGVSLLIASYDNMKPLSEEVNIAVAEWVKQGGTFLYVGGHDAYEAIEGEWWMQEGKGGTPYNNLLSHLGLNSVSVGTFDEFGFVEWAGPSEYAPSEDNVYLHNDLYGYTASYEGEGITPLLRTDTGATLGFETSVGKGKFLSVGLSGYYFASTNGGSALMKALCQYAVQYSGYQYVPSPFMRADRGNYTAVHALQGDYTLPGTYVDVFDSTLRVVTDPVVTAGQSALYYNIGADAEIDLAGKAGGASIESAEIPGLAFFGGKLHGEIVQTADVTELSITGPANSVSSVRLLGRGKTPSSIEVTRDGATYNNYLSSWNNATGSLFVQINNSTHDPVTLKVHWGTQEKPDDPVQRFREKAISAGAQGNDADYIVRFTGQSLASSHFCDMTAELVYRLDLSDYPHAWLTLTVSNNYVISVSDHDGDWIEAYNYKTMSGGDWASSSTNQTTLLLQPDDYGLDDVVYLRLSNSYPDKGWGGAIHSMSIYYIESVS